MKNERSFVNCLVFTLLAGACIWMGINFFIEAMNRRDYNSEWKFGLSSPYTLGNKMPDGSYFFPQDISLNEPAIEVSIDEFRKIAVRGTGTNVTLMLRPQARADYLTRYNGSLYHAVLSANYSENVFSPNKIGTTIKSDDSIICAYSVIERSKEYTYIIGVIAFAAGAMFFVYAIRAVSVRARKITFFFNYYPAKS